MVLEEDEAYPPSSMLFQQQKRVQDSIPCNPGNYSHCPKHHGQRCCVHDHCGDEDDCVPFGIITCEKDNFTHCPGISKCCYQGRRCGTEMECQSRYTDVPCQSGNFSHCPTSDGLRCCRHGHCGTPEDCQLMEGADCTHATQGDCPSWFGASCCLQTGQCGTLECAQEWPPYMAVAVFAICSLCLLGLVGLGVSALKRGSDEDHFAPGVTVFLHGLKRNPHYNHSIGVIERYDAETGIWSVKMRSGGICAVRRENLALAELGEGELELAPR